MISFRCDFLDSWAASATNQLFIYSIQSHQHQEHKRFHWHYKGKINTTYTAEGSLKGSEFFAVLLSSISSPGVLMQCPVVLSQFTFALGRLGDLSFSLKLTCWAPWISQISTTGFLQFVLEQSLKEHLWLEVKINIFWVISRVVSMVEPATEESECFSFLLALLNSVAYDLVKHISLSMPFIVT